MRATLRAGRPSLFRRVGKVLRRVIGVPDYEAYLAHLASRHPGERAMTRAEFERDRMEARYNRPGARCC